LEETPTLSSLRHGPQIDGSSKAANVDQQSECQPRRCSYTITSTHSTSLTFNTQHQPHLLQFLAYNRNCNNGTSNCLPTVLAFDAMGVAKKARDCAACEAAVYGPRLPRSSRRKDLASVLRAVRAMLPASHDGSKILLVDPRDTTKAVAELRHALTGHSNLVSSVSWAPDGRKLASGSADKCGTWRATSVRQPDRPQQLQVCVSWAPDGRTRMQRLTAEFEKSSRGF